MCPALTRSTCDAGCAIDLVGTGKTMGVELPSLGLNDCLSAFFWREVDLDVGAVELFADPDFNGTRTTIFLSEWSPDTVHPVNRWWLENKISSMRWRSLDRQEVEFFNHIDGSGEAFRNATGYSSIKQINFLKDIRVDDCLSSFSWRPLNPKKEVVHLLNVQPETDNSQTWFSAVQRIENNSPTELSREVTFEFGQEEEISITTTDSFANSITASITREVGVDGPVTANASFSMEVSFSYEHSTERSKTFTQSLSLSTTETLVAPAFSTVTAYLAAQIAQMPARDYTTTVDRWYEQPVRNSELDPSNGWYKRTENIKLTIKGGLASSIQSHVDAVPLPGHEADASQRNAA